MPISESDLAEMLVANPSLRLAPENRLSRKSVIASPLASPEPGRRQTKQKPNGRAERPQGAARRVFKLELPLPPIQASPNGRFHWGARARATRLYREICGQFVQAQIGRQRVSGKVIVDLDFYLARKLLPDTFYRPRDKDNAVASIKAAIDSLKDAKLITNDSKKHLNIGRVDLHTTKKEHQGKVGLVITIRET